MIRLTVLIASLLSICLAASAQPDEHMTADPAGDLFRQSAWAHGYLHGYVLGFHYGDIDVQLSHPPTEIKQIHQFKNCGGNFKKEFGDRKSYLQGCQAGFRVGYEEAYQGQEFQALRNLRDLSRDIPRVSPKEYEVIDLAIQKGYLEGSKAGLDDARTSVDYRPDGADCELSLRFKPAPTPYYCSVYALGYRLGYSDGFLNQRPKGPETKIAGSQ